MDYSMRTPPPPPNVFEYAYGLLKKKLGRKEGPVVECVNQQNIIVEPLDMTRPCLRFSSLQNKLVGFMFVAAVFLTDSNILPFMYKVWIISFASLAYLIKCDLARIPIRYVHPLAAAKAASGATSATPDRSRIVNLDEEEQQLKEFMSTSQCEFHILQVKVLDQSDGITNPGLNAPTHGSRAVFQITVICGRSRWEVWRKYEHFCRVYDTLCSKYAHHKIARLPSLERIKKTWRNLAGGGAAEGNGSASAEGNAGTEETAEDDAIFLGHAFLQKLQAEMLGWLRTMQLDPIGDDVSLRALLKLPPYKAQTSPASGSTQSQKFERKASGRSTSSEGFIQEAQSAQKNGAPSSKAPATAPIGATPVKADSARTAILQTPSAGAGSVSTKPTSTASTASAADATTTGSNSTADAAAVTAITAPVTATAPVAATDDPAAYVSPCGCWKGRTVESFMWTDLSPEARDMYIDIKYTHDFKVRDRTYMTNKKKVDAGPGIAKLALMENIHVDTAKYGDRLDNIAAIGRVKRRIEIMNALQGNPFVIVLNLQIPGDPPCSIVFYFIVPLSFYPGRNESDGLNGARDLFRQFIDIPITPVLTESPEFLAECLADKVGTEDVPPGEGESGKEPAASTTPAARSLSRKNTPGPVRTKSAFFAQPAAKSWTSDVVWPDMSVPQPGVLARDSFQNKRFKLIPSMVEAPWVVQMAVSSTPVLLGQKVVQRYYRGERYIEIDVHVGCSSIADNIVGVCRSYSKAFICNLGIVIQGEAEAELPEQVLACAALKYTDIERHSPLESFDF